MIIFNNAIDKLLHYLIKLQQYFIYRGIISLLLTTSS